MGSCGSTRLHHGPLARICPSEDHSLDPSVRILNLNLHEDPWKGDNIKTYYRICRDATSSLHVTTSCFSVWKQHNHVNGYAKVIPVAREGHPGGDGVRVFFFDDNLEWNGTEGAHGICNLRDINTGAYVDFSEGCNGFCRENLFGHSFALHSAEYRIVLVKANLLDSIGREDYFWSIIQRYARPDDKLLVYMDVNSTIMCADSIGGKDLDANLLSIMSELIQVNPRKTFELAWDSTKPLQVRRRQSLKELVKNVYEDVGKDQYKAFWNEENVVRLLKELAVSADLAWQSPKGDESNTVNPEIFREDFRTYLLNINDDFRESGITRSWFHCYNNLRGVSHSVILNSFGVDTRKVVLATVPDERQVMQVTVNYELWEDRDKNHFKAQYHREPAVGNCEEVGGARVSTF